MTEIKATNIDAEAKRKASFVLSARGKNLTQAVREMVEKLAKEYDKMEK